MYVYVGLNVQRKKGFTHCWQWMWESWIVLWLKAKQTRWREGRQRFWSHTAKFKPSPITWWMGQIGDLAGRNLHPDVVGRLLSRGVFAFRCPRSFMDQPLDEHFGPFRLQHLDLSNSVINVSTCMAFCLTVPSCWISAWKASGFRIPLSTILLKTQIYCD